MAEAEVDPKILNENHTYFVPVDRSSPSSGDAVNDVVINIKNVFRFYEKFSDYSFSSKIEYAK